MTSATSVSGPGHRTSTARSGAHAGQMIRSSTSCWTTTALPTISTCSTKNSANGRTTTISTDPTELSMGKPHTSGSWPKRTPPACHRCPETLHDRDGGQGQNRTADTRIFSPRPGYIRRYSSIGYRGARCVNCPTMHNGAGPIPARLPRAFDSDLMFRKAIRGNLRLYFQ
jgi:hypothetical protein